VVLQTKQVRASMAVHPIPVFEMRHRMALALEYGSVSVNEIAAELGVSRTTISNYLWGRTVPRRADLVTWAFRTNVPLEWLLDGTVPSDPPSKVKTPKRGRTQGSKTAPCSSHIAGPLHNVQELA
jgi:transcriptional regulator with XRE-family HTH domain